MANQSQQNRPPPRLTVHSLHASVITCSDFFLLFRNLLKRPLFSSSFWVLSFPGTTFPGKNAKTQRLKNQHQSHEGRLVRQNTCTARRDRTDGSGGSSCREAATVSFSAKRVSLQATYLRFQHFTPHPPTPPPATATTSLIRTASVSCVNLPYCVIVERAGQVQRGQ